MKTRTLEVIGSLPFHTVFLHFAVAAYASIVHANIVLRSSRFCSFTDQTKIEGLCYGENGETKRRISVLIYLFFCLYIYIYIYIYICAWGCAR
jgi:hypothetical protein